MAEAVFELEDFGEAVTLDLKPRVEKSDWRALSWISLYDSTAIL